MAAPAQNIDHLVDHLFREEYGKMVSFLTTRFGFRFLEAAEDLAQETLMTAFQHWSQHGVPAEPRAWLFKVARNKAVNYVKREEVRSRAYDEASQQIALTLPEEVSAELIEDSVLRMIFACCHPEIASDHQLALILRTLCGFGRKEIARALLSNEATIKKRLYRAREALRQVEDPLQVPGQQGLEHRLSTVSTALYLLFNEGYSSTHEKEPIRKDLCLEAVRLARLLVKHFPDYTPAKALLALMCFHTARFESRIDRDGALVLLEDQDRGRWDQSLIKSGLYYLAEASQGSVLSPYHLEASIAAQHCLADSFEATNWAFITRMYEQLYEQLPNPVIRLNLAVIKSRTESVEAAITELLPLTKHKALSRYPLLFLTLGTFYSEVQDKVNARDHLLTARSLSGSDRERAFIDDKLTSLHDLT